MTWIKFCGTTNAEDALACVQAGADALGFVFAPSPRCVSVEQAGEIVSKLPEHIEKVGVFVNDSAECIAKVVSKAGLTAVQLHGDESLELARSVREMTGAKMIRAIPVSLVQELADRAAGFGLVKRNAEIFEALLIDSVRIGDVLEGGPRGGTGQTFAWDEYRGTLTLLGTQIRVVLAGGLRPENVKQAIDTLHPWGVDVVSGVESAPGIKDHQKLQQFVRNVRQGERL